MRKLQFNSKPFCNDCHFFLFAVIFLFISIKHPIFTIVLILYLIFILRKTKYILYVGFLFIFVFFSYAWHTKQLEPMDNGIYEDTFEVIDYVNKGILLKGKKKILVYDEEGTLNPGDIIEAKIKIFSLAEASYRGDFDAKEYYASKGITNQGRILEYSLVNQRWTISRFKFHVLEFFRQRLGPKSFNYAQALFFGINAIDSKVKSAYSLLYLSHILSISGLHIHFFYKGLLWIFQKIFKIRGESLAIVILGIYVIFIGYPISCLRAYLFLFLSFFNQKGTLSYTKLDILSISFLSIILWSPYQIFQSAFIFSFVISFILIFMEDYVSSNKKIKKIFLQNVLCICSILPLLINQTNEISFVWLLLSCFIGFVLGKFLLPLAVFVLFFPVKYLEVLFEVLDKGILLLGQFSFPIGFPTISFIGILAYYSIYIYVLIYLTKKKKMFGFVYLILYFLLLYSFKFVNPFYRVTFIDVGQGDSIFIELPNDKGSILVDSYGDNIDYLKSKGIKKLDYVILTHFDYDHMSSIGQVVEEFQVDCILYSLYENKNEINSLNVEKKAVSSGDSFLLDKVRFEILGPIYCYEDSNSNSVVVSFDLDGYTFLLTGDMTEKEEKDLIQKYGSHLRADVLKVGHHGSSTSSSQEFLEIVSPRYSIISVGENNAYGLPSKNVYDRLTKISNVYMTKDSGNIQFYINNELYIYPYRNRFHKFVF